MSYDNKPPSKKTTSSFVGHTSRLETPGKLTRVGGLGKRRSKPKDSAPVFGSGAVFGGPQAGGAQAEEARAGGAQADSASTDPNVQILDDKIEEAKKALQVLKKDPQQINVLPLQMALIQADAAYYVANQSAIQDDETRQQLAELKENLDFVREYSEGLIAEAQENTRKENEKRENQKVADDPGTGIGVLDDGGYACDNIEGNAECTLTAERRRDVFDVLQVRATAALINYQTAIQNARIQQLTKNEHGWGFMAEFLFYSISGPLIGSALKAFRNMRLDGLKLPADVEAAVLDTASKKIAGEEAILKDVLTNASRGIRGSLKAKYNGVSDSNLGHAEFLKIIQDSATSISVGLLESAHGMTDQHLIETTMAYVLDKHTVEVYSEQVDKMIAAYDANKVGELNVQDFSEDEYRAVNVKAYGRSRLAIVAWEWKEGLVISSVPAEKKEKMRTKKFVRWVEDDFQDQVKDVAVARSGSMDEIDITAHGPEQILGREQKNLQGQYAQMDNKELTSWYDKAKEDFYKEAQAKDDERNSKPPEDDPTEHEGSRGWVVY